MTTTREQIIETACGLMETQGYHATGLNQIVKESGAPKGSLYYYFPDGKEAIAAESILQSGRTLAERTQAALAQFDDPAEGLRFLTDTIAGHMEGSGFQSGGPLQAVAVETATTNERLNQACREAYQALQTVFEDRLRQHHLSEERARSLAGFILSALEGAIVLSRTYHSGEPLRAAGRQLAELVSSAAGDRSNG